MKKFGIIFIILYITFHLSPSPILLRGIVEGFYGTPWNFEIRSDLLKFCGEYNLNAYIYAPKDDPYHREKWRDPYPAEKIIELKNLVEIANQNKVHFIFAISPGLDLNFEGEKGDEDINFMMNKLESMYNIGIRYFAIFFDDLTPEQDGFNHANFLNKIQNLLNNKYNDIPPLITVPFAYSVKWMIDEDGEIRPYTKEFSKILNKKIIVLYTGDNVVSDGISENRFKKAKNIYKRNLGIWWNYPVNDYYKIEGRRNIKLALGPIEKLPKTKPNSIFFNPMEQPILSKISIATGAEYALSTINYNPINSWNKILEKQFGNLAPEMKLFASHSQYMNFNNAICGPEDAPEFYKKAHKAVLDVKKGKKVDISELNKLIDEMENAANILLEKLPKNILDECKLMLEQFQRIAKADRVAALSLSNNKLNLDLVNLRQEIKDYESVARVSEFSAVLFIDEVIELFNYVNI